VTCNHLAVILDILLGAVTFREILKVMFNFVPSREELAPVRVLVPRIGVNVRGYLEQAVSGNSVRRKPGSSRHKPHQGS
jgi:hypothetical protein